MIRHHVLDDAALEAAALHALDALEPAERARYEAHLGDCAACRAEVAALSDVVATLGRATEARPPASLRARLMERVGRPRVIDSADAAPQAWKDWAADGPGGEVLLLGADATGWEQTGFAGVEARRLFVDAPNDRVTMLIRMAPGARYPSHAHGGPEECYVIAGDLAIGDDFVMTAGSYQRVAKGSAHPDQTTRSGCLLLITSSLSDELLAR